MPHPDSEGHTAGFFLSLKGVQLMWQAPRCVLIQDVISLPETTAQAPAISSIVNLRISRFKLTCSHGFPYEGDALEIVEVLLSPCM